MEKFDLMKAEEFSNLVDNSKRSTSGMPAFVLLDREFLQVHETVELKRPFEHLFNHFLHLNSLTFIRYRNEALFIINGNQKHGYGCVLTSNRKYNTLPILIDHYQLLNQYIINSKWRQVELEKLDFE